MRKLKLSLLVAFVLVGGKPVFSCDNQSEVTKYDLKDISKQAPSSEEEIKFFNERNTIELDQLKKNNQYIINEISFVKKDGRDLFNNGGGSYNGSLHILSDKVSFESMFGTVENPGVINKPQEWTKYGIPKIESASKSETVPSSDDTMMLTLLRSQIKVLFLKYHYQILLQQPKNLISLNNGIEYIYQNWSLNKMLKYDQGTCSSPMYANRGSWLVAKIPHPQSGNPDLIYIRYNVYVKTDYSAPMDYLVKNEIKDVIQKMVQAGKK